MTNDNPEERVRHVLRRALGQDARAFTQLKGGRNSRVFRVDLTDGSVVAAKAYFRSSNDERDRMGCEFRALQLLESEGLRNVARPVVADAEHHVAIYGFIEGQQAFATEITPRDVRQALGFLRALKEIAASGRAQGFGAASEACFSIEALFENLNARMEALERAAKHHPALAQFLADEFNPFRNLLEQWVRDFCLNHGIAVADEIPVAARTLSPSDFGFHNALRRPEGDLAFLDFEYFGWDDPAKTICDFLLHPGMELSVATRQQFFAGAIQVFSATEKIEDRVRALCPLFALKWGTILLNEFTLDHAARRSFAVGAAGVWGQTTQLEKARRLLGQARDDYHNFPYHA